MVYTQEIAAEVLQLVEETTLSAKEALRIRFSGTKYGQKIRRSVHAYVLEVLKRKNTIDFLINISLKNKNILDLPPFLRNILRIGVYELVFKKVPPPLATDSTVRIAKNRMGVGGAALSNAVLRRVEYINLESKLSKLGKIERISLKYSHPQWFVRYIFRLLGEKGAIELMKANLENPTTYLRVNTLKASEEKVLKYLDKNEIEVEETLLENVFRVIKYKKPPASLDWHNKGYYVIQDLASSYVAHVVNPGKDETILDLAAAPGAKTSHLSMIMENKGKIIAIDNSKDRIERMKHKLKSLGVENVEYILGDGTKFFKEEVDKVLVDPPCSSTGVFRTFPCVKWRYDKTKYKAMIKIQRAMIKNALRNLKEGGTLVYSTCSITFEENEENINYASKFFKVEKIEKKIGTRGIKEFEGKKFFDWNKVIRTFPHLHSCSGFFIAKMTKS
ncbi:MAG: RNA methyltransferase [Thermoplasmata archaeon]|nr:MAG: RNA methyltransferase [Thermoplasmata archaeon]